MIYPVLSEASVLAGETTFKHTMKQDKVSVQLAGLALPPSSVSEGISVLKECVRRGWSHLCLDEPLIFFLLF